MKLLGWATHSEPAEERDEKAHIRPLAKERRVELRENALGLKLIVRQRKALGIIHLRDISSWGASGMTDMPLAVGSLVFFELKKGHFYGARVKWVRRFTIGVNFAKQMKPETVQRLVAAARKARQSNPDEMSDRAA